MDIKKRLDEIHLSVVCQKANVGIKQNQILMFTFSIFKRIPAMNMVLS